MKKTFLALALGLVLALCSSAFAQTEIKTKILDMQNNALMSVDFYTLFFDSSGEMVLVTKSTLDRIRQDICPVCPVCPTCPPGTTCILTVDGAAPQNVSTVSIILSTGTLPPVQPVACTYVYSDWTACQPNNTQTHTVISFGPAGCTGNPVLTQPCTYVPPVVVPPFNPPPIPKACAGVKVAQPTIPFPSIAVGPTPQTEDQLLSFLGSSAGVVNGVCPWLVWGSQSQANLDWVWANCPYSKKAIKKSPWYKFWKK